jgi:purine-cytosine permease-like protein
VYFVLILEESVIFQRSRSHDLTGWNDLKVLPVGFAALLSFCYGIVGTVVGLGQTWYTRPIASMIGDYGRDIETWLAISFAAVAYPGLRCMELKKFDR